jgi:hypothetical protein
VLSPILSNIYLDRLDRFVETVLVPQHTRGERRRCNPEYNKVRLAVVQARRRNDRAAALSLARRQRSLPAGDPQDPGYRRLRYLRYADDHLLGFTGPRAEAEQIKVQLAQFLRDELKLELSQDKTLITHARTHAARFLGYEIAVHNDDRKITNGRRTANGVIVLRVPSAVVTANCAPYLRGGRPEYQPQLLNLDDHEIVKVHGARYRGIVQYYLLAGDVWKLSRLHWVMLTSMLKTLAAKHHSSVGTMARRHQAATATPHGPRRCFEVCVDQDGRKPLVVRFGGIPLRRQKHAVIHDRPVPATVRRTELIVRLQAGRCELCGTCGAVRVHHVRSLADLATPGQPQPAWAQLMATRRRKTLVVCSSCHDVTHSRQPAATPTE